MLDLLIVVAVEGQSNFGAFLMVLPLLQNLFIDLFDLLILGMFVRCGNGVIEIGQIAGIAFTYELLMVRMQVLQEFFGIPVMQVRERMLLVACML
jgi:hypothetical protein